MATQLNVICFYISEYMELEEEMSKDKKALLEEFERRRKARQLNVSTDDDEVTNLFTDI